MVWFLLVPLVGWLVVVLVNGWRLHSLERQWERILLEASDPDLDLRVVQGSGRHLQTWYLGW